MKRDVKIIDGWPETMTLPRADQFIAGMNTDNEKCGCLWGHVAYAFGIEIFPYRTGGGGATRDHANKFASEILQELLGYSNTEWLMFTKTYDTWYYNTPGAAKKVAHAWRVVADRHGYDVQASEPRWRP